MSDGADDTLAPLDTAETLAPTVDDATLDVGGALTMAPPDVGAMKTPDEGETLHEVEPERYARGDELARGGMGRIVLAEDLRLRRPVALKEMLSTQRNAALLRFEREALITARLQHPGIVSVQDAGRWPSGEAFYAMEMVRGRDFETVIAELDDLASRMKTLPVLIDVADAMAYAHSRGVVHRDLKPANILVGAFGETIVIDWGIARLLSAPDIAPDSETASEASLREELGGEQELTQAGSVMGTPAYMAPEQAEGLEVDERADVYAIGAMIYHLFAGEPPHTGNTGLEILWKAINSTPEPLRERVPGVPEALQSIVDRAMARQRSERYANAGELAEELRRFASGQLVASHNYTLGELVRRWVARHRGAVLTAAGAVVVLAVVVVVFMLRLVRANDATAQANSELSRTVEDLESTNAALANEKNAARKAADAMIEAAAFRAALGDPLDAVELFDFFRELYQDDAALVAELQLRAAQTLEQAGEHALAATRYRALAEHLEPGLERYEHEAALARNLWKSGDRDGAMRHFEALLDLEPTDERAREILGEARFMRAEVAFGALRSRRITSTDELKALTPELQRAASLYEKARGTGSPRWELNAVARLGELYEHLYHTIANAPVPADAPDTYQDALLEMASPWQDKALSTYAAVAARARELRLFTPYAQRAQEHLQKLRPGILEDLVRDGVEHDFYGLELRMVADDHPASGRAARGVSLFAHHHFSAARSIFDELIQNHPELELRFDFALAVLHESAATDDVFLRRGLLNTAVEHLQRLLSKHPDDIEARVLLALIYTRLDRSNLAQILLRRASEFNPDPARRALIDNTLGLVHRDSGQAALALEAFERSGSLESGVNAGGLLLELRDFPAAREAYESVVDAAPDHVSAALGLAVARIGEGRAEEGIAALREILRDFPEELLARFSLAVALQQEGLNTEALDAHIAFFQDPESRRYPRQRKSAAQQSTRLAEVLQQVAWMNAQSAPVPALSKAQIRDTIRGYQPQITSCWNSAQAAGHQIEPSARLMVSFVIDNTGRVRTVSAEPNPDTSAFLIDCILAAAQSWQFPEPNGSGVVRVRYPFVFSTR